MLRLISNINQTYNAILWFFFGFCGTILIFS
jgi:hypothetical protein